MRKSLPILSPRKATLAVAIALAIAGGAGMVSCSSDNNSSSPAISSLKFDPIPVATSDAEKQMMRVSPQLTVTYADNTSKTFPLSYTSLAKMGDTIGSGKIGLMTDEGGNPILKSDGSEDISDGPDGNSLIKAGDKYFLVTHMEERPGELYKTERNYSPPPCP